MIDENGIKLGVLSIGEALSIAMKRELDLVEVGATATPPVCRLMNYGKLQYKEKKRRKDTAAKVGTVKEISVRLKISEHDLGVKMNQAAKFIEKGYKVKFNILFRGREKSFFESLGMQMVKRLIERMGDRAVVERKSELVGNKVFVIFTPAKPQGKQKAQKPHNAGHAPKREREPQAAAAAPSTAALAVREPAAVPMAVPVPAQEPAAAPSPEEPVTKNEGVVRAKAENT